MRQLLVAILLSFFALVATYSAAALVLLKGN